MLRRLLPKKTNFLQFFGQMTDLAIEAAQTLVQLMNDIEHSEKYSSKIKSIEQNADEITHITIDLIHSTFITPIDREAIYRLAKRLDDIIDFVDGAAARITIFEVKRVTPYIRSLAEVSLDAIGQVQEAVRCLSNLKDHGRLLKIVNEINHLENRADKMFQDGVSQLFREEQDIKELIKLKEIYEILESVTDRCEDAADVIESIVVEHT